MATQLSPSLERAAVCHSLLLRLPPAARADTVDGRLARLAEHRPGVIGPRLWRSRGSGAREALRPLRAGGAPLRAVLVENPEGPAELVLVADRCRIPAAELAALADWLTADDPGEPPLADSRPAGETPAARPATPWGLGDPRRAGRVSTLTRTVSGTDEARLRKATALTLSRYEEEHDGGPGPLHLEFGEARPGRAYTPALAPPLPMSWYWERAADGTHTGHCQYDEGAIAADVAHSFADHLARTATDPDPGAPVLTDDAARAVLALGSTPAPATAPGEPRIDRRIAELARLRPDAPAVSDEDGTLSYRELTDRANLLAAGLRALGVTPGSRIGVCLDRSATTVVAFLAVLRTGCAYVPMDPRYPAGRLRHTATDAGVPLVITTGDFPATDGVRTATPEELATAGARWTEPVTDDAANPPAYVIYTSGSTGRPKGVTVPHGNVTALIRATAPTYGLGPDDVWTFFHSSAFDFSVWEIWGCLLTGGRLTVVPYWVSRSPDDFRDLLAERRVTVLSQTPSAFSQLIEADRRAAPDAARPAPRLVVFGGEPLDPRTLGPWFAEHPPSACRLVNMFGITETTVHVTARTVTPADTVTGTRSVGRALPGWSVSVRDEHGRVLPPGPAGEIWVGGAGVAEGYLGRPELTAERFVTDPLTGERLYRSGDKGRLRPDGGLEHLGRIDSQVKIRGHRVELDEIRAVLLATPQVAGAAVILREGSRPDRADARIDAYAVLRPGATVRQALAECRLVLPDYMVPGTLTEVPEIPLTLNGKLDTARLPQPRAAHAGERPGPAPRPAADDLAATVLKLWAHHLDLAEVRPDDNFFEIGGNSLLVIRVLAELRDLGLPKVSMPEFYRHADAGRFIELLRSRHTSGDGEGPAA
ncbi:amino acid adenylation domain-containing protein [Streptomyces xiamenensis]|uniref:amino acid adenylation domain-containing protein n=1 Tax=Streptomyces xiamenensis TaxID=408015 RepID=UPI0036A57FD6